MEFSNSIQDEPSFLEEEIDTYSEDTSIRKMTLSQYLHLDSIDLKKKKEEKSCCKNFKMGLRMISVGQYNTKLFHNGEDSESSVAGGTITILCGILLIVYASIILSGIIRKDKYNLDLQTFETQTYDYILDPVTNQNSTYLLNCHGNSGCSSFTIENLLAPFFEKTQFVIEFPREYFSDYNCLNLKGSLKFWNESGLEDTILDYGGESFQKLKIKHICYLQVNITQIQELPRFRDIKDLIAIWDQGKLKLFDTNQVRFYIEISGIPKDARYYRRFFTNMEVTLAGLINTYSISNFISRGTYLNDDFMLARYQEYDSIWWIDEDTGSVKDQYGLQLMNDNSHFYDTVPIDYVRHRFWVSKYFTIYKRFPATLAMGFAQVGGIMAIFKIAFFLQLWHRRKYYKCLSDIHKQSRIKVSAEEPKDVYNETTAKKLYSLETLDRLAQLTLEHQKIIKEQRIMIDHLQEQNKKLN